MSVRKVALLAPVLFLGACSWFTDFKQQPKIDPWETPNDTTPFRGNPQMSVPTYGSAAPGFEYDRMPTPQSVTKMAGIQNPIAPDSASINRGRINFQINCAVCHGPQGMGNGPATKYGFPGIGIGVGSNAANTLTDGYIFGMIRNGRGLMPSYNRIEEPDRWDIINYLRTLQGKNPTFAADTSHCRPGETGMCVPSATRMGPTRPAPYYHQSLMGASASGPAAGAAPTTAPGAPGDTSRAKAMTDSLTKKPEQRP